MKLSHKCIFAVPLLFAAGSSVALELGARAFLKYIDYEEFDLDGSSLNHETGFIPGIQLNLNHGHHRLWTSFAHGEVNYDGQLQSGTPYTTDTRHILLSGGYEYAYRPEINQDIALIVGFSGQRWQRNLLPNNGIQGVTAVYEWQQLQAGLRFKPDSLLDLPLELDFSIIKIINGTVDINLNSIGYGSPQLELGDRYGFVAGLKYYREISSQLGLSFSMESSRWEFGRSDSQTLSNGIGTRTIAEPRSVTWHTNLGVEFIYRL